MRLHFYVMLIMYSLSVLTSIMALLFAIENNVIGIGLGFFESAFFLMIGFIAEINYNKSKIK